MQCPVCDARLREIQKYGVEVDICPECKGVWLDRGELEKIIDMVSAGSPEVERPVAARPQEAPRPTREERPSRDDDDDDDDRRRYRDTRPNDPRHPRKKRESWFSEIFDAFGGD